MKIPIKDLKPGQRYVHPSPHSVYYIQIISNKPAYYSNELKDWRRIQYYYLELDINLVEVRVKHDFGTYNWHGIRPVDEEDEKFLEFFSKVNGYESKV
jgi:hypothetical protein